MKQAYDVESYWSEVGSRIAERQQSGLIAGDDDPFYIYKRNKFLKLLNSIDFTGKTVLEVGSGPGGNLMEVYKHSPKALMGADISQEMIDLAGKNCPPEVQFAKTDGKTLPFNDNSFDIVFTVTVLQHNTNETDLKQLIGEMCRVSKEKIYLFERIEKRIKGDELNLGRPVAYYENILNQHGFNLKSADFIKIQASYLVSGTIRKIFNKKSRKEGEPQSKIAFLLQQITLVITKALDKIWDSNRDLAKMEFVKK